MSSFAAEFPISPTATVQDVARLACQWITGSPHSGFDEGDLNAFPNNGEQSVTRGGETVVLAHATIADGEIGGLRYDRQEENMAWTTTIVSLKSGSAHLLRMQVVCEALTSLARLPPPKKPYFIKQALAELGGGNDGEIPVTDKPFRLSPGEEGIAAAMILGTAQNSLPIVYVSMGFDNKHLVDPAELATFVGGLAHVVVEPSRAFSSKLRSLTKSRNAFGGTISVYWPDSDRRKSYYADGDIREARALAILIAKDIRVALSHLRHQSNCTWLYLKEAVAKSRVEQLKAAGSTELDRYVEAFDADIEAKEQVIAERDEAIRRLNAEVRRLSNQDAGEGGLIRLGQEQDLYEHEVKDIIVDALRDALDRVAHPEGRRRDVLEDLLRANTSSGKAAAMAEEIKELLRDYRSMDAKTRSALTRLGFDLIEDGRHWKMVFHDDQRYAITFAKTGSDHRGGLNMVRDINNKVF